MDSFFAAERLHFFRPLTGKYREQAGWLLNLLLEYGWMERHVGHR